MGMRNWMRKSQDPEPCRTILEDAKVHQGLSCHKKVVEMCEKFFNISATISFSNAFCFIELVIITA